jgi:hypothetical protein
MSQFWFLGSGIDRLRRGGVLRAVQEYRGDEGCGFLDAGLVFSGQAGRGLEHVAEQGEQFLGGVPP